MLRRSKRGVAQLASALAWGARGRPFKSVHPDKDRMRVCDKQALFLYKPFANNLQTFLSNAVFRKGAINR